ncbi:MAG: DUF2309 domain-containing protein [Crocinitomicaceae bacterium]
MKHTFSLDECLHHLKHYLPAQFPLKDFVHHNTLHAFQDKSFFEALQMSNEIFGYKSSLSLSEYRDLFEKGHINESIIDWVIDNTESEIPMDSRKSLMLNLQVNSEYKRRIGHLRSVWKNELKLDLNTLVHLNLFKLVGSYLDQGISAKPFPNNRNGLINAISDLEKNTFFEFFHSKRVKQLLFKKKRKMEDLLAILVGNEAYYEQYLFDQQFAHPGWSGMVAVLESNPDTLLARKKISFKEFVYLELLLEIDALDSLYGEGKWKPVNKLTSQEPIDLFANVVYSQEWEVKKWWQTALENSYFDQVLFGIVNEKASVNFKSIVTFQAYFCIDDREESLRRHIEVEDSNCQTFGSPAFYSLPIYYRPAGGKFNTKVCPNPVSPQHIIMDDRGSEKNRRDLYFHQSSNNFFSGWMISQTMGFWSALKLFVNIFKPSVSPGHSSSFEHMSHKSNLIIENVDGTEFNGLKVGFTKDETCNIIYSELKRTGLVDNFAPIVYFFGHGGSSTNNPYYAGYNCGACSGRPSSLNARVFASMANQAYVREFLKTKNIEIPAETQFIGGLHDTTRDELVYYDIDNLSAPNQQLHLTNIQVFKKALQNNAKERARQFISIDIKKSAKMIHKEVKKRSVALFEPRPELNHSNNCLCIVGSRAKTKNLFLDQRAFLNSYNWKIDLEGESLTTILGAATPVCGGINLEYYFSRVDNENYGAGSKLPHNVVGLFGVANGIEGDLRTGLPLQMIEVHHPMRLMMIVNQKPEVVLAVINKNPNTLQWYQNDWVKLAVIDPETNQSLLFQNGVFMPYTPIQKKLEKATNLVSVFESSTENLPVLSLN